jgi:2-keto-4-pentenoate hydratase/2-oxohepta-3-ene-1,7-dioic acid hydratase in catechol pathway
MRIANLAGRAVLVGSMGTTATDVAELSVGRFGPDPMQLLREWAAFTRWARALDAATLVGTAVDPGLLGPPVPEPRQVFAFGLNYAARAAEGGQPDARTPVVFTKFPTCLAGPHAEVALPSASVDWEVELVAVIGLPTRDVTADEAWSRIAGLMIGQDLSDRAAQFQPPVPQFSLSKSHPGFGPTGPWLVTLDEVGDPSALELEAFVNGERQQHGRSSQLIVGVADLVARLSAQLTLLPGDLVFTGTPGGVGHYQDPPRYLKAGDRLTSVITGLGRQEVSFR